MFAQNVWTLISTFQGRCLLLLVRKRSAHHASHGLTGVDIDAINYAIKHTAKIKAKFSYGDQINVNKPVLKPGRPE